MRIASHIDTKSADFRENREYQLAGLRDLEARLAEVRRGGGEEALAYQKKQGKLSARERSRIARLAAQARWNNEPA